LNGIKGVRFSAFFDAFAANPCLFKGLFRAFDANLAKKYKLKYDNLFTINQLGIYNIALRVILLLFLISFFIKIKTKYE